MFVAISVYVSESISVHSCTSVMTVQVAGAMKNGSRK